MRKSIALFLLSIAGLFGGVVSSAQAAICEQYGGTVKGCVMPHVMYQAGGKYFSSSFAAAQYAAAALYSENDKNLYNRGFLSNATCRAWIPDCGAGYNPEHYLPINKTGRGSVTLYKISRSGSNPPRLIYSLSNRYISIILTCPKGYTGTGERDHNDVYVKMCRPMYTTSYQLHPTVGGTDDNPDIFMSDDGASEDCQHGCNPVSLASQAKSERVLDYQNNGSFPFVWERIYNSRAKKWSFNYYQSLKFDNDVSPTKIFADRPNGSRLIFNKVNGNWVSSSSYVLTVLYENSNGFVLENKDGLKEFFNNSGALTKIRRHDGEEHLLSYSGGKLTSISDSSGRSISIQYKNFENQEHWTWPEEKDDPDLPQVGEGTFVFSEYTDEEQKYLEDVPYKVVVDNQVVAQYEWVLSSGSGFSFGWPLIAYASTPAKETGYIYGTGGASTNLLGIVDGNANRYATYTYADNMGKMSSSTHGSAGDTVTYVRTYMKDSNNQQISLYGTTDTLLAQSGKLTGQSAPCASCGGLQAKNIVYDTYGNATSVTDFDNRVETRTFDGPRGLMLSRTEAFGTPKARTVSWTWHASLPRPLTQVEPIEVNGVAHTRTTTWTYDAGGRPLTEVVSVSSGEPSRTTTYTYNDDGDIQTITHPNGMVERFVYDTMRQLSSRTQGFGTSKAQTTTYGSYDVHGYPNAMTDASGVQWSVVRDGAHRVRQMTKSNNGLSQQYETEYDLAGLLTAQVLPSGRRIEYTYDDAHRLITTTTKVGSNVLSSVHLTYTNGNKISSTTIKNGQGETDFTQGFQYDQYRRLTQVIDAHNHASTRTLSLQGLPLTGNDAAARSTSNTFDALARLTQVVDANNQTSTLSMDVQDNLVSAADQRNVTTTFAYNGFGDLTAINSPDRGSWAMTYNAAGENTTITDPRGVVQTISYDILGRQTQVQFDGTGLSATGLNASNVSYQYTYDTCTNGASRLCVVQWNDGERSWSYDGLGRVTAVHDTDDATSITLTTQYAYNNAGQIASITYPSGKVLVVGYTNTKVSSLTYDGQQLATNIVWNGAGQIKGWEWGLPGFAGLGQQFVYDTAGNIQSIASHAGSWDYTHDNGERITSIAAADPSQSQTHAYDKLNRLTQSSVAAWNDTLTYAYDHGGNRVSTLDTSSSGKSFAYDVSSNRLLSKTPVANNVAGSSQSVTTDVMGNIINNGLSAMTYDVTGRLINWNSAGQTTDMSYNPFGQRRKKVVSSGTGQGTYLEAYDTQGRLIGVYQPNGQGGVDVVEELVYLDGWRSIATVRPDASLGMTNPQIHPIVSDHLQTPRYVLSPSTTQAVWSWDAPEAFGMQAPSDNLSGTVFDFDSRFPGQRFDVSTGALHNGWRTYDPSLGRYLQSDPLGLEAGWNTYAYVEGNPVSGVDPLGLSRADMARIDGVYHASVVQMIREGRRGEIGFGTYSLNNTFAVNEYGEITFGTSPLMWAMNERLRLMLGRDMRPSDFGLKNFNQICVGQALNVLDALRKYRDSGALDDGWDFALVDNGSHYWVEAYSNNKNDDDLLFDPWSFETRRRPHGSGVRFPKPQMGEFWK